MKYLLNSLVMALSMAGACSGASAAPSHSQHLLNGGDEVIDAGGFEFIDAFQLDVAQHIFQSKTNATDEAGWSSFHGLPWSEPGTGYADFTETRSGHRGSGHVGWFDGLHDDGPGCAPAVPEPQEAVLLIAGLSAIGLLVVRRRHPNQR